MSHYDEARGLLNNVVSQNVTLVGTAIHAATAKPTPVDADELPVLDSAISFTLKKFTWANLKTTLAAWINGNLIPAYFTIIGARNDVNAMQYMTLENRLHQAALTQGVGIKLQLGDVSEPNKWGSIEIVPASAYESSGDIVIKAYNGSLFGGLPAEIIRISASTGITVLGGATMLNTSTTLTNGAGASAGTLSNAPAAGNPTKWIAINDNGVTRRIPAW